MTPSPSDTPLTPTPRRNQTNRHTRRWLPYAGAVIFIGLVLAGLWPQPVAVETATVAVGTLRATVNEEGKTRIRQRYVVSAPVAGQLQRIPFKEGDAVQAGKTVVAVIAPLAPSMLDARARTAAEAARDSAAANLEKARAQHAFASNELLRFQKLRADQTVSIEELESAQLREAETARALAAAEGAVRQAEAELAEFNPLGPAGTNPTNGCPFEQVIAPATGRVLRVFEENARVVTAGTTLLEVGDPSDLEAVVEVLSRDGAAITPGDPVELEQWGGGAPLRGRVRLVEPAAFTKVSALGVEEQRVKVIVDLLTPPERRRTLGDDFRVEAGIVVWQTDRALKVPAGALFRRGNQWAVFLIQDGRARLRLVTTGRSSGAEVQILEGLKEGDQVILYPGTRLHEGQRVKPIQI